MAAFLTYFFIQKINYVKYDYDYLLLNWGVTISKSAAARESQFTDNLINLCVPSLIFFSVLFLALVVDKLIPEPTPIQQTNTYRILIKRPTGWISLFKLIFWHGDISLFANGVIYKRNNGEIDRAEIDYPDILIGNYFIIDTFIDASDKIDKRICQSGVDKSGVGMIASIIGYERLFLTNGFKRGLLLILIRWLSFSVSELNRHEPGAPLRGILVVIFNYPINSLKKLLKGLF